MMMLLGAAVAATARRRLGRRIKPSSTTIPSSPLLCRRRPLSSSSTPSSEEEEEEEDPLAAVALTVNGRAVSVPKGISILEAARSCGVLVPTLCAHPRLPAEFLQKSCSSPETTPTTERRRNDGQQQQQQPGINNAGISEGGLCRVCLVDVGGGRLAPACATPVAAGMAVQTDTDDVKKSVRGVLALLRASGNHEDCATCEASGECELQALLARYHVVEGFPRARAAGHHEWDDEDGEAEEETETLFSSSSLPPLRKKHDQDSWRLSPVDASTEAIAVDLSKCVECGRCVSACGLLQGVGAITFVGRGARRHVGTFGGEDENALNLSKSPCIGCGQCSLACPTGAIEAVPHWRRVARELEARRRPLAAQVAPAVRVAIGEELGLGPGEVTTGRLVAALRLLGFDYVFDTNFAADVTVVEESAELLRRLQGRRRKNDGGGGDVEETSSSSSSAPASTMPLFTSCCPAWITMAEKSFPELVAGGHLSTTKSPHVILGTLAKKFWAPSVGIRGADLFVTSIMPCTAKKAEAARRDLRVEVPVSAEGGEKGGEKTVLVPPVDAVLTTRELGRMLRARGVPLASLDPSDFDSPLGDSSGAAALFGATGGVAEAALRSVYKSLVGSEAPLDGAKNPLRPLRGLAGVKELVLPLPEEGRARELAGGRSELRVAVASGAGAARALVERIRERRGGDPSPLPRLDFVEVMACPGGCVGGGGQPRVGGGRDQAAALAARARAVYALDAGARTRRAHENEGVRDLYARFLGDWEEGAAGSGVAERELHRDYGGGAGEK